MENDILFLIGFAAVLILMLIGMPFFIRFLKKKDINQVTSEYALAEFKNKEKTPIMGGLLFVVIPVIVFFCIDSPAFLDRKVLFIALSYLLFCSVGFIDDALVIRSHTNDGLSPWTRLGMELLYTTLLFYFFRDILPLQVTVPFVHVSIVLPWFVYLPFMILLYMAEANAVNFTDGMDGLCAGVSFIVLLPVVIFALHVDRHIALLLVCILAGLLGYLRFNFHPAKIFMGDSGSLALGALFASTGLLFDKCFALFFIGGVFVMEMFCVVLQQLSVRIFHKRVFSYTPIHYAFVLKGYRESNIVLNFYLLAMILSLIGLFIGLHT